MAKETVVLGMSGGIDSSMAAMLLLKQGMRVVGMTLQTHTDENASHLIETAQLATSLGIEHVVIDCRQQFKDEIIAYFANEYIEGRTPNPCVQCNQHIKWKHLLQLANQLNAKYISTGHYVRTIAYNGEFFLQRGLDPTKDQSYFLWNLDQKVLSRALFPLGHLQKNEVRQLATMQGLSNLNSKKESMGVCFLAGTDYKSYLTSILPADHPAFHAGDVVDEQGSIISQHDGYPFYTIGQRKGINGLEKDHCVTGIDTQTRTIRTGHRQTLFTRTLNLKDYQLTPQAELYLDRKVFIRVRGVDSVPGYYGSIELKKDVMEVRFDLNVWGIAPGQSIVIYQGDKVIGGGIAMSLK